MTRPIVIAAGGTGGHFFPAEALATELHARGHTLVLMTDARGGQRDTGVFANAAQFVLPGAGVAGRGPIRAAKAGMALLRGAWQARGLLGELDAAAVVGFGGYPSVPPLLGGWLQGPNRPALVLHEGNAVLGKANALLARVATAVATSFPTVRGLSARTPHTLTGMPVRPGVAALYGAAYVPPTEAIHLLIWGGSLGASVFSEVMPAALAALPGGFRARLHVTQQVRESDIPKVRDAYAQAGIDATLSPFFTDVPQRLAQAHLVIGRAGGSSVAELTMAGRPSILVPLPIAASDEQGGNAQALMDAGAAWMIRQPAFTPSAVSALLADLLGAPARLAEA
ncbi:UDP-N-acetylglucosamine--N-acetylmuramyl-(pentapeptide) pyrophosphoryl-undecaprenol N-acetylglucosamine transferase, partial [Ameyamaea chiangmaiensis]